MTSLDVVTTSLGREKYVLLTTFRKDGTPVPTPIWVAEDGGELVMYSERDTGKVKRIRRDGTVRVQACDLRGRTTHGPEAMGTARLVEGEDYERVRRLLARKYGLLGRVTMFVGSLRGPKDRTVGIAVRLDD